MDKLDPSRLEVIILDIFRFIFISFYRFFIKHWARIAFSSSFFGVFYSMISLPNNVILSNKVEFRKIESDKIYYFYKIEDNYESSVLDKSTWGTIEYDHDTKILHRITTNDQKAVLLVLVIFMGMIQLFLIWDMSPYFDVSDIRKNSLLDVCRFELGDDGHYRSILFGRIFKVINLPSGWTPKIQNPKSYLSIYSIPSLFRIWKMEKFSNVSLNRNRKISKLGI